MLQYSSGPRGDRHHLVDVPLLADGNISKVNITISQRPDGSDWLLGVGSSGKVSLLSTLLKLHELALATSCAVHAYLMITHQQIRACLWRINEKAAWHLCVTRPCKV